MEIDWKRKLTSRKFWAALAQFATGLIIAFGGTQETAVQVTGLIMSGAAVVAYIIGEGLVDAANVNAGANELVANLIDALGDEEDTPEE